MFRAKRCTYDKSRILEVKNNGHIIEDLGMLWDRIIFMLECDYVEIFNGPKIYWNKFEYPNEPFNGGHSSFRDYVKSQEADVRVYLPKEYCSYV